MGTHNVFAMNNSKSALSFYDNLRRSPTAIFRPVRETKDSPGRAMHVVFDPEKLGSNKADSVTLCHVPIFLRYSDRDQNTGEVIDVSQLSYGGTAAALLAMHHFNNGDGSVVEDLAGINSRCNIRFTTEVVDTQSSSVVAVQNLANLITDREETDYQTPQACAVMGAAWYEVSQSMATVTGVYDLLQVSPSSSSMSLDSMSKYPLFSRTHPSDEAKGVLAVEYFQEILKVKHVGILFINSELGISLQKKVVDLAAKHNMTVRSVAFDEDANEESLRNSLMQLKDSQFSYFLGIFFPLNYDYVMEIATDVGVAGPGKFWLFTGHLADAFAGGNTTVKTGSGALIGSLGNGILHDDGMEGLPEYDTFLAQWKKLKDDQHFVDYINSKQPAPPAGTKIQFTQSAEYFDLRPSHYAQFSYDAIAGMGLAACEAAKQSTKPDNYFTGKEHHNVFVQNSFIGASGNVTFAPDSFSRAGYSTYYFVSEIFEVDRPSTNVSVLSGKTGAYFDTNSQEWGMWPGSSGFVYSDGSTTQPAELPPFVEARNTISTPILAICILFAAMVMLTSVGLMVFVAINRKSNVIMASQPPFLYMLCAGTLVLSSAIIPLMIDDSIVSNQGCSIACMSEVWLVSIGFTITFSALFSKTWRVNKLFKNAQGFRKVTLKPSDASVPFFILFCCNVLILSLWTAFAPLEWHRTQLELDPFGRPVQSVGRCYNKNWLPYGTSLYVMNAIALVLVIWEAYKGRHITTEFSESKYIAMAVVSIFQALLVGVPLYFIAKDWPLAQSFVLAAIIFIICMAVLLLIFVPKVLAMRNSSFTRSSSFIQGGTVEQDHTTASMDINTNSLVQGQSRSLNFLSEAESITRLEEQVWNSIHQEELERLKGEYQQACGKLKKLQSEIESLTWGINNDECNSSTTTAVISTELNANTVDPKVSTSSARKSLIPFFNFDG